MTLPLQLVQGPSGTTWVFCSDEVVTEAVTPTDAQVQGAVAALQAAGRKLSEINLALVQRAYPRWRLSAALVQAAVQHVVQQAVAARKQAAAGYEIRDAGSGHGLGVFAVRAFAAGERIMSEAPLLRWKSETETVQPAELQGMLAALPPADRDAFEALAALPPSSRLAQGSDLTFRVWAANAYPTREIEGSSPHASSSAVYRHVCRINHACRPNCAHAWNERLQRMTVHATQAIGPGEELTLTYLGTDRDAPGRAERQQLLQEHFDFTCGCSLCALPKSEARASDRRRTRLVALCESLHAEAPGGPGRRSFADTAKLLEERLALLREEGVAVEWAHGAMFVVMVKASQAGGRRKDFKMWAERTKRSAEVLLGKDSVQYQMYAHWAQEL